MMKRVLTYLLPFLVVTVAQLMLQRILAPLGHVWSIGAAAAITLALSLAIVILLRRNHGRLSATAYTFISASCIPVVIAGSHLARQWTNGGNWLLEILIAAVPAIALLYTLEPPLHAG